MLSKTLLITTIFSALLGFASGQTVLHDFSLTVTSDTFFYGSFEASGAAGTNSPNASFLQNSGTYDITGSAATDASNAILEFFFPTPKNISGYTWLTLTAQALPLNAATSFRVFLADTASRTASAIFTMSSFPNGSYSTVSSAITFAPGFDKTAVEYMDITGAIPSGTARFNISLDNISATPTAYVAAVPEPSTYAAIVGVLALGFVAYRRRSLRAA